MTKKFCFKHRGATFEIRVTAGKIGYSGVALMGGHPVTNSVFLSSEEKDAFEAERGIGVVEGMRSLIEWLITHNAYRGCS